MFLEYIKFTEDAKTPTRNDGDAGYDLYSIENVAILPKQRVSVKTGIGLSIPENHAGFIWPRSGYAVKQGLDVLAGLIDSTYRGEIIVCLLNTGNESIVLPKGSKVAQIVIQQYKPLKLVQVHSMNETSRGENGFGSTGQ